MVVITLLSLRNNVFNRLLLDIYNQIQGAPGNSVLSIDNAPVSISKYAALIDSFVPFEMNRKPVLNRIITSLTQQASLPEHFEKTASLLANTEMWLDDLAMGFSCDIVFPGLSVPTLIKAAAPEIRSNTDSVAEKMLDLMELTEEFDRLRLFFTVNMRSYVTDEEMSAFVKTVISHGYPVIGIESSAHPYLSDEKRVIIDSDLCEIT